MKNPTEVTREIVDGVKCDGGTIFQPTKGRCLEKRIAAALQDARNEALEEAEKVVLEAGICPCKEAIAKLRKEEE
jgi:hypothetical protein